MKKHLTTKMCLFFTFISMLTGCEKMVLDEESDEPKGNVTISVAGVEAYNNAGETRVVRPLTEACTRICFAIYQDGKRVKYDNQSKDDKDYGTFNTTLDEGKYQILVLGHSSLSNPSTTDPNKIAFNNAPPVTKSGTGYSDTFYYYGDITVGEKENYECSLKRATAMFRFITTDVKPANVKRMWFQYTAVAEP